MGGELILPCNTFKTSLKGRSRHCIPASGGRDSEMMPGDRGISDLRAQLSFLIFVLNLINAFLKTV